MHQNGSQKEEGNFLNLLQKEGVPSEKGGGGSNPGENYGFWQGLACWSSLQS